MLRNILVVNKHGIGLYICMQNGARVDNMDSLVGFIIAKATLVISANVKMIFEIANQFIINI